MTPVNYGFLIMLLGATAVASTMITYILPNAAGFLLSIACGSMLSGFGMLQ